ncbi:hypothetical protein N431DRAFT_450667 [Stipitochalara longipes BDJ]|nr:hypothetical protein N431DRAFT_450667 [Stipitochalara longipes BDJ]
MNLTPEKTQTFTEKLAANHLTKGQAKALGKEAGFIHRQVEGNSAKYLALAKESVKQRMSKLKKPQAGLAAKTGSEKSTKSNKPQSEPKSPGTPRNLPEDHQSTAKMSNSPTDHTPSDSRVDGSRAVDRGEKSSRDSVEREKGDKSKRSQVDMVSSKKS